MKPPPALFAILFASFAATAADDIVIADFEGPSYGEWTTTGTAFGAQPAHGTLPGQMRVDGFHGKGLVNSFHGGDASIGTLTSPPFTIQRRYISFLIGGGGFSNETCMNLLVDGHVVRSATGPNTQPGGSEELSPSGWDVAGFNNRQAVLEIVDRRTGGWGHINVDQIVQTDQSPPIERRDVAREFTITRRYLHFPVKNGAARNEVRVLHSGQVVRSFDIGLADSHPDWWAFLDVSEFRGSTVSVQVNKLRSNSHALDAISQDDSIKNADTLYSEPLRPQLHFSARRGWNNDPNGLVYFRGAYHLFFQHNPFGWDWGNMHWGHAVSRDLVHWREQSEALYPDALGPMFSGSAVVDWKNTSGFGSGGAPPLVLIYTAAGNAAVQCLAFSNDGGKTFSKYAANPVLKQITGGNRDPKVLWHEPTKRWVMVLYVGFDEQKGGRKTTRHTIHFLTSPNLKDWTVASEIDGFFECPDLFELPIDSGAASKQWVLTAASSEYMVGNFDGEKFTPTTATLPGHRGKGFYAAQTYSDIPASDGRRLQFGWLQAPSPGMSFNQCMTLPLELTLRATPDGPRLAWQAAKETEALRRKKFGRDTPFTWTEKSSNVLAGAHGELLEVRADFEPGADTEVRFDIRGVPIVYSAATSEISVNGHRAPAPLNRGRQRIAIFTDRTAFEVFAGDGLTYVPMPVIPKPDARDCRVSARGAPAKFSKLVAYTLNSIWK